MNTSEWADLDGIPDVCGYEFGDFDLDGAIGGTDLAVLFGLWGSQVRPSAISRETTPLANLFAPPDLGLSTAIAGGGSHTVALESSGVVRAWGDNVDFQCAIPPDLGGCLAVSTGGGHSIAMQRSGLVRMGKRHQRSVRDPI